MAGKATRPLRRRRPVPTGNTLQTLPARLNHTPIRRAVSRLTAGEMKAFGLFRVSLAKAGGLEREAGNGRVIGLGVEVGCDGDTG